MKRDFLKSIEGLTDEVVDKIMAEAGKDINTMKAEVETLKTEKATARL